MNRKKYLKTTFYKDSLRKTLIQELKEQERETK